MKILLFLTGVFISNVVNAQIGNNEVLRAFLNDPDFCRYALQSCERCDTIKVVDTLNSFTASNIVLINGRIAIVRKDYTVEHPMPKTPIDLRRWTCSNLFVSIEHKSRRKYIIRYFHTPTNGSGYIEFKNKHSLPVKVKSQFGQF